MPAQILHTLFGEDATRDLLVDYPRPPEYDPAFALGCQGPDLFYHSRRRPVALEYGTLLHRRNYGTFAAALLRRTLTAEPSALGWYALGFASHAALDRALHPYIVYKAGWVVPARQDTLRYGRNHTFFERVIDTLMVSLLRGSAPVFWDQKRLLAAICANPPIGLAATLEKAFLDAYPERAGRDEKLAERITNALQEGGAFYEMTNPADAVASVCPELCRVDPRRSRSYLALVHPDNLPLDIDYLNLARREWFHPCAEGSSDNRSLPELYRDALKSMRSFYIQVLTEFRGRGTIPPNTADLIGNGTLSIGDREGKPCAPVHTDPLSLDEVLDERYRHRLSQLEQGGQSRAR